MNLLNYLDQEIELYRQKNNNYPKKIIMSKETKDKLFAELGNDVDISLSWTNKKDNYRGIPVEIKKDIFLELKGE
jgi:hypothetical protein